MAKNNVNVTLTANVTNFKKQLSAAAMSVKSFASGIVGGVGGLVALTGASLTAGAAIYKLTSAMSEIDQQLKTASRLGTTTEFMAALTLQAKLSDVEVSSLSGSLAKMVRNVSEAATGNEQLAETFSRLGLNAGEIAKLSTEDQFRVIADAVGGLSSATDQAAAALQIFGKGGLSMVSILQQGSAGLDKAAQTATALGTSLGSVDASKVEMANDAITLMGEALNGVFYQIAVKVAPYIQAMADYITEVGTSGSSVGQKVSAAFSFVGQAVTFVLDAVDSLIYGYKLMQVGGLLAIKGLISGFQMLESGVKELFDLLGLDVDKNASMFGSITKALDAAIVDVNQSIDEMLVGRSSAEKLNAFFSEIESKAQANAEEMARIAAERNKGLAAFAEEIEVPDMKKLMPEKTDIIKAPRFTEPTENNQAIPDGQFRQFQRERFRFDSPANARRDPVEQKLDTTNGILGEIRDNLGFGLVGRVA